MTRCTLAALALLLCSCTGSSQSGNDTRWQPLADRSATDRPRSERSVSDRSGDGEGCVSGQGFPYDPTTKKPICPPYSYPAVFFSPSPYHETLLMGGGIREHVQAGRQVFIELMTHGEASGVRATLNNQGTCTWHTGSHTYPLDSKSLGDARVAEFLEAAKRLGVTGVFVSDFGDGKVTTAQVGERIQEWMAWPVQDVTKGLSFKGTYGSSQPDIKAIWDALVASGHADVRGYGSTSDGTPSMTPAYDATICGVKTQAWAAYEDWDPAGGWYAIGRHSCGVATPTCTENVWKTGP
jgi:hypothetical protein